jgi:LysM repeat protein
MKWKDSNEGGKTEAEEEGSFEENYSPLRTQKLDTGAKLASIFTRPGSWLVIIPVLLLAIFLFAIRPGGSDKAQLTAMDHRLQQIEIRMAALEGVSELVADLDNNRQATKPLKGRLDRLESSFVKKIGEIDQRLKDLQIKLANTKTKQAQKPAVKSPTPKKAVKQTAKTHIVKKGETLYSISRQYGLSLNQLISYNKLSKKTIINPGQSLKLTP